MPAFRLHLLVFLSQGTPRVQNYNTPPDKSLSNPTIYFPSSVCDLSANRSNPVRETDVDWPGVDAAAVQQSLAVRGPGDPQRILVKPPHTRAIDLDRKVALRSIQ
jgi:hypothetical protein